MSYFERHNAIVSDVNDPDKIGRIKVKCSTLIDEEQELPFWISPYFEYVDLAGGGWFGVPAKDTWVELLVPVESKFDEVQEEQSLQMEDAGLRWSCTTYNDVQTLHKYFKKNYPQRYGYAWPSGWVQYIDAKTGEMVLCYAPDEKKDPEVWIKILKDHTIELGNKDGMKIQVLPSKILIEASGGPVEVVGDNIKLGGSAATEAIVLGTTLDTFITGLITELTAHVHTSAAPGAPTSTPTVPFTAQSGILSTKHTVE